MTNRAWAITLWLIAVWAFASIAQVYVREMF